MKLITSLAMCSALALSAGCANRGVNLVESGTVSVEQGDSKRSGVTGVRVRQVGDQTVVDGAVVRADGVRGLKGYVQVDVIDSRGVRIDSADSRYAFRKTGTREARTALFSAHLSAPVPAGSVVVVQPKDSLEGYGENKGTLSLQ